MLINVRSNWQDVRPKWRFERTHVLLKKKKYFQHWWGRFLRKLIGYQLKVSFSFFVKNWNIHKQDNIHLAHKHITTLRHLLTNLKDRDEPNEKQGGVYKTHTEAHRGTLSETDNGECTGIVGGTLGEPMEEPAGLG